jgi:glycosyltransferase involved in cell wall biosynthesis
MNSFIYRQAESLKSHDVNLDYLFLRGRGWGKYLAGIRTLRALLSQERFDIIHAHYSYNGYVASYQDSVPVVTSFMGSDLLDDPDQGLIRKRVFNRIINKRVASRSALLICKSDEMKHQISNRYNRSNHLEVIPNGVPFDVFMPLDRAECRSKLGLELNRQYVLFASDPHKKNKNLTLAHKAWSYLGNDSIELLTVHNQDQDTLNLYFNAVDVLICTSLSEGSPNVIKEAMACNLPIVSTDVGDVRRVAGNTEGCHITNYEPRNVADAINKALVFGKRTNGRSDIRHLEIQTIARRIIGVYERVLR